MTPRLFLLGDSLQLGGTEGQFVEIASGLRRSGWDVDVSCLRAEGPLRPRLEAAGIRPWSCGPTSLKSPTVARTITRLARHLRATRPRIFHSFDFYSNVLGVLAARLARVPVVFASQRDLGNLRPRFQGRVNHLALRFADRVVVNAGAVADRLVRGGIVRHDRVTVIPNGVDVLRFRPAGRLGEPRAGVTVGTLANLRPEKGLIDIVRAAGIARDRHPDIRFLVFGDGPLRSDLHELIRASKLERSVELRGSTEDPAAALRELDVFILASQSEACSNSLLEAMATRLAIVATDVGGNSELVEDERSGLLVPPADPAGLAKAIIRLVEEPTLAARLADAALARVHAEFSLGRMLGRLETLYGQTMAFSPPR